MSGVESEHRYDPNDADSQVKPVGDEPSATRGNAIEQQMAVHWTEGSTNQGDLTASQHQEDFQNNREMASDLKAIREHIEGGSEMEEGELAKMLDLKREAEGEGDNVEKKETGER